MSKRPKEIYEPGELLRVRRNLGNLTPEEEREAARILGGEVGAEHSATESPPQKEHSSWINRPQRIQHQRAPERIAARGPVWPAFGRPSHFLRIVFRAAAHAHRLIPRWTPFRLFFFPYVRADLRLRAQFVRDLEETVYRPVEALTMAARRLRQYAFDARFDRSVLDLLATWDLDFIRREIAAFGVTVRRIPVRAFLRFLRSVYRPIVALRPAGSAAVLGVVYRALEGMKREVTTPGAIEHMQSLVIAAESALEALSGPVPTRLYPLLMLAVSPVYRSYEDFFVHDWPAICSFVDLTLEEIPLPDEAAADTPAGSVEPEDIPPTDDVHGDETAKAAGDEVETPAEESESVDPQPAVAERGDEEELAIVMDEESGLSSRGVALAVVDASSGKVSMTGLLGALKELAPGVLAVESREGLNLHYALSDLLLEWYFTVSGGRPPALSVSVLGEKLVSVAELFAAACAEGGVLNRGARYRFPATSDEENRLDPFVPAMFRSNGTLVTVLADILAGAAHLFERVAGEIRERGLSFSEAGSREYDVVWTGWGEATSGDEDRDRPLFPIEE